MRTTGKGSTRSGGRRACSDHPLLPAAVSGGFVLAGWLAGRLAGLPFCTLAETPPADPRLIVLCMPRMTDRRGEEEGEGKGGVLLCGSSWLLLLLLLLLLLDPCHPLGEHKQTEEMRARQSSYLSPEDPTHPGVKRRTPNTM